MGVAAREDTPHAEHGGKTWYFCSEYCREQFVRNPGGYVPSR
jgi:YHS domain-containing protein